MTDDRADPSSAETPNLRQRAERRTRVAAPALVEMTMSEVEALVHELQVHQAELEVQNEDLRSTQQELAETRDQYVELYDFAPVGYMTLDAGRLIRQANLTLADMLGVERSTLIGTHLERYVAPQDQDACYLHLRRAAEQETEQECEMRFARPNDSTFWGLLHTVHVGDSRDSRCGYRVTLTDVTDRRRAEEDLRASRDELEQRVEERTAALRVLALKVSLAEEQERRRLASTLHDDLAQVLSVMTVRLSLLRDSCVEPDRLSEIKEIMALMQRANRVARSLMNQLSHPALYDIGFVPAVEWLAEDIHGLYGLTVTLEDDGRPKPIVEPLRVLLFQCLREVLVNAAKHARVEDAHVSVLLEGAVVRVVVRDEGVGFDPSSIGVDMATGGFGLFSIRERLGALGGRVEIRSKAGCGTTVLLEVPVEDKE